MKNVNPQLIPDAPDYKAVVIATVGVYIAGNVTQKWTEKTDAAKS